MKVKKLGFMKSVLTCLRVDRPRVILSPCPCGQSTPGFNDINFVLIQNFTKYD